MKNERIVSMIQSLDPELRLLGMRIIARKGLKHVIKFLRDTGVYDKQSRSSLCKWRTKQIPQWTSLSIPFVVVYNRKEDFALLNFAVMWVTGIEDLKASSFHGMEEFEV